MTHVLTGPRWLGAGPFRQLRALTVRALRGLVADRRVAVFGLINPLFLLFVLSEVFGSMANPADFPAGVTYIEYLVPALMLNNGIGAAQTAGMALVRELGNGMLVRFRSMPVHLPLVLTARALTDLVRSAAQLIVLQVCAFALLSYSPAGGLVGSIAAMLVALFVIHSMIWIFLALAAWLRSPDVMQSIGLLVMFPLMFASSAFVPVTLLPTWLQVVATVNPLTYAIDAARSLVLADPHVSAVLLALLSSAVLGSIAAFAAARGLRKPITHK
uniref:Transport permease protein n=1 Tax=uncultured bacterium esnapd2 TaxID=1366601 RepID=S5TKA1_9BACT|nr:hypothetical protein [uncultured bacterium esnapd2]